MSGESVIKAGRKQYLVPQEKLDAVKGASLDEIEFWLTVVMEARDETKDNGKHLFSPWEREFVLSLNTQYDTKHVAGYHTEPLTPKQIYYLHRMYRQLVADTTTRLEAAADKDGA